MSKLTLLFMAGMFVMLSIDGFLTVRRETAAFDRDLQTDARLFGQFLAHTIREAWHSQGRERALAMLREANANVPGLHVAWVPLDQTSAQGTRRVTAADTERLLRGESVSVMTTDSTDGELYTYIPVQVDGSDGALELAQPLRGKHEFTETTMWRIILLVALTLVVCTILALGLGTWLVGGPIRVLVARTREIGAGQLDRRLELHRRDEIGMLADEIDRMSQLLLEARQRVARETDERVRSVEQLRHADRLATVGTLAAGVAHELGTPLNVIMERAALVQHHQMPNERIADNARIIREQSERIAGIVRQLLDFARTSAAQRSRHDVCQLVGECVRLLQPFARKQDVELHFDRTGVTELYGMVAPEQIQQALTNLIMNAIHASGGHSSVTIAISRESTSTPTAGEPESPVDHICIRVQDRGTGIEPDHLPRIFEPFFTTKDVGEGTGLGLSVTYGIIRDHDGWIAVDSIEGKGTCFALFLPLAGDNR